MREKTYCMTKKNEIDRIKWDPYQTYLRDTQYLPQN